MSCVLAPGNMFLVALHGAQCRQSALWHKVLLITDGPCICRWVDARPSLAFQADTVTAQVMAHHPDFPTDEEVEEVGAQQAFAPFQKMLQFALEPLLLAGASLPAPEPPGTARATSEHQLQHFIVEVQLAHELQSLRCAVAFMHP